MSQENASATGESVCGAFRAAFHELGRAMAPPEEVESHFREARKHVLMGLRAILDERIERLSRNGAKGTNVPVD
jgi:L-lactate utilization protein LutB